MEINYNKEFFDSEYDSKEDEIDITQNSLTLEDSE